MNKNEIRSIFQAAALCLKKQQEPNCNYEYYRGAFHSLKTILEEHAKAEIYIDGTYLTICFENNKKISFQLCTNKGTYDNE